MKISDILDVLLLMLTLVMAAGLVLVLFLYLLFPSLFVAGGTL